MKQSLMTARRDDSASRLEQSESTQARVERCCTVMLITKRMEVEQGLHVRPIFTARVADGTRACDADADYHLKSDGL